MFVETTYLELVFQNEAFTFIFRSLLSPVLAGLNTWVITSLKSDTKKEIASPFFVLKNSFFGSWVLQRSPCLMILIVRFAIYCKFICFSKTLASEIKEQKNLRFHLKRAFFWCLQLRRKVWKCILCGRIVKIVWEEKAFSLPLSEKHDL